MQLSPEQLNVLRDWNEAKQQAKTWVEKESTLRDALVKQLFNADKDEGTETIQIENGWSLKASKKLTYSLNNDQGEVSAICATLPDAVSRQLVRWKPELSLSTYRKLDGATAQMFQNVLTIKPSKPSLELLPPPE
jgi:hypothetical protein